MNNQHFPGGYYHHYGDYRQVNTHSTQGKGWPVGELSNLKGIADKYPSSQVGNVCAYVADTPVQYKKLNITHWPSQDYVLPHPKGFAHTLHNTQHLGQYVPYRTTQNHSPNIVPQPPQYFSYFPGY